MPDDNRHPTTTILREGESRTEVATNANNLPHQTYRENEIQSAG